jgi:hypothetical protein
MHQRGTGTYLLIFGPFHSDTINVFSNLKFYKSWIETKVHAKNDNDIGSGSIDYGPLFLPALQEPFHRDWQPMLS